ncbi:MAG: hypothetical protein ACLQT6_05415 [Desulfomonilaceae bacterium]
MGFFVLTNTFKTVWETPVKGDLPVEILFRLPLWCVYSEVPEGITLGGTLLFSFFVHLEDDQNGGEPELRIPADTNEGFLIFIVHLIQGD